MQTKHKRHSNLLYVSGDILDSANTKIGAKNLGSTVIIPHVCNNVNLFGAGFAGYLSNKYPAVKENFHMLSNKAKLGYVQYITIKKDPIYNYELVIANMIAQNQIMHPKNLRPLNYESLVKCMIDIRNYILTISEKTENPIEIHSPKFGSGLAGGNWAFIENLIEDIWKNIPVYIYTYNKSGNNVRN